MIQIPDQRQHIYPLILTDLPEFPCPPAEAVRTATAFASGSLYGFTSTNGMIFSVVLSSVTAFYNLHLVF